MSSIFGKSLLWFFLTLVVCLVGSAITNELRSKFAPGRRDFMSRSISLQLGEARHAYEDGGVPELRAYFNRLDSYLPGKRALLDANGRNLVTGVTEKVGGAKPMLSPEWLPLRARLGRITWPSKDNKYIYIMEGGGPPSGPWTALPYYLWIALASTAMYYVLAVQVAGPVRTLEQTVERFGHGDLAVRASMTRRRDEIGNLARAFDLMADRIETLLSAERRLLQDVSHELRSPLARLEFAVELARTSADQNRSLDRIKKEVGRLSTLVSELLQVTRVESDPESQNLEEISVSSLLADVVEDCRLETQARNSQLILRTSDCGLLRGDRELLRRAIENVIRNAVRYAPEETAVEVSLLKSTPQILITIRDYGSGVPEESLGSLFKPFFRVEADRSRNNGGGVGLGLSIAQRAIAVHKGMITAKKRAPGTAGDHRTASDDQLRWPNR